MRYTKYAGMYMADIADFDPQFFDWMVRKWDDSNIRQWFDQNVDFIQEVKLKAYRDVTLPFGKYKGRYAREIAELYPTYLPWFCNFYPKEYSENVRKVHMWMELYS